MLIVGMNRQGNTIGRPISGFNLITECSPPHIDTGHIVEILVLLNALCSYSLALLTLVPSFVTHLLLLPNCKGLPAHGASAVPEQ